MKKYRVKFNDEIKGPYERSEIINLVSEGFLPEFVKCNEIGTSRWLLLSEVFKTEELKPRSANVTRLNLSEFEPDGEDSRQLFIQKMREKKPEMEESIIDESDLEETKMSKSTDEEFSEIQTQIKKNLEKTLRELDKGKLSKDKTQFYNLDEFKEALKEADETEKKLEEKSKAQNKVEEIVNDPVNKRAIWAILLTMFLLVLVFVPVEENLKQSVGYQFPKIKQPLVANVSKDRGERLLVRAKAISSESKYSLVLKKLENLQNSIASYNFKDSRSEVVNLYSRLLPFAKNKQKASKVIYDQYRLIGRGKELSDKLVFESKIAFYFHLEKYRAVKYLYEKYKRLNGEDTQLSLALYIKSLIRSGKISNLQIAIEKAIDIEDKKPSIYFALQEYLLFENNYTDYEIVINEAFQKYPENLQIIYSLVNFYNLSNDVNNAKKYLSLVNKTSRKSHPLLLGKYYELKGVMHAIEGQESKAVKSLKASYKVYPREEIIYKLSKLKKNKALEVVANELDKTSAMINLRESINYGQEKNWNKALLRAVSATDQYPNYLPAQIQLAKVQIKRGYYDDARRVLKKIVNPNFLNDKNRLILELLSKSQKFKEFNEELKRIDPKNLEIDDKLNLVIAEFYDEADDQLRAILWLKRALDINPINDEVHARLAKVFFKQSYYIDAKKSIKQAIEIDPSNTDYHITYAKLLFAENGINTASGYLRNLDVNDHDQDVILNQIAIFHYQNGEISTFKKLIASLNISRKSSKDLYYFLMKTAADEEKYEEVVKYGQKYIYLNPSDHDARLFLGQHYFYLQEYERAEKQMMDVYNSVDTYPEVNAELSKLALIADDFTEAKQYADKEIMHNPNQYHGYLQAAKVEIKKKKLPLAEGFLKKALRVDPENVLVLTELGNIYMQRNKLDDALSVFLKAQQLDEDHYNLYYRLGEVYKLRGNSIEAKKNFQTYLELNPRAREKGDIEKYLEQLKE